jgi:hypothetical protein
LRWARCDDETYAEGMPLWLHDDVRRAAKAEAAAFNTEAERLAARPRRIEAVRNISPDARMTERKALANLYEIPRLRQITGNIVHLHTESPSPVVVQDFIAHDLASASALDNEILAPCNPIAAAAARPSPRDRRDAGQTKVAEQASLPRRTASRRAPGDYK